MIVTGGGCALLYAAQELDKVKAKGDDQKAGVDLVRKALEAPIRQITKNAGVDGSVVVGKLLEQKKKTHGYDAQSEEYCDMFASIGGSATAPSPRCSGTTSADRRVRRTSARTAVARDVADRVRRVPPLRAR